MSLFLQGDPSYMEWAGSCFNIEFEGMLSWHTELFTKGHVFGISESEIIFCHSDLNWCQI